MVEINVRAVAKKICQEYPFEGCNKSEALTIAYNLKSLGCPELKPYIEGWLEGREEPFEFLGVSSSEIMNSSHNNPGGYSYLEAIFIMANLFNCPELVDVYVPVHTSSKLTE